MPEIGSLAAWREEIGRHLLNLDFRPAGDGPFSARVEPVFQRTGTRVTNVTMSPGTTFRDASLAADGTASYALVVARRHSLRIKHGKREISLSPGSASIMRNWEPGSMTGPNGLEYSAVVIPESALTVTGAQLQQIVGSRISKSNNVLGLVKAYARMLAKCRPYRDLQNIEIQQHLTDLVRMIIVDQCDDALGTGQDMTRLRLMAVHAYLEQNFADPALTVGNVANGLGISVRYVEHLLMESGQTYTSLVRGLRLERARRLLEDPERCSDRIIDIAFEAGFSDLSHFNRQYRNRFGETPSETRERQ